MKAIAVVGIVAVIAVVGYLAWTKYLASRNAGNVSFNTGTVAGNLNLNGVLSDVENLL